MQALALLVYEQPAAQRAVVEGGGLALLVPLLGRQQSADDQAAAALAVSHLAGLEANCRWVWWRTVRQLIAAAAADVAPYTLPARSAILAAGIPRLLTELVRRPGGPGVARAASAAIKELVAPESRIVVDFTAQHSGVRQPATDAVIAAGGIRHLLALVKSAELAADPVGTDGFFVSLAEDPVIALAGLAACEAGAAAIAQADGIPLLLELLTSPLVLPAVGALGGLVVESPQRQDAVARAGGVVALAGLLREGSGAGPQEQHCALVALRYLAERGHHERFEPWVSEALLGKMLAGGQQGEVATAVLDALGLVEMPFMKGGSSSGDVADRQPQPAAGSSGGQPQLGAGGSSSGERHQDAGGSGVQQSNRGRLRLAASGSGEQQAATVGSGGEQQGTAEPETSRCAVCGSRKEPRMCSGCRRVAYCSEACQKAHWRQHKKACRAVVAAQGVERICL